jgi:hypothetical protein
MKKKLLSLFAFATVLASSNAQTYFSDDFTGGINIKWTTTDLDGDNLNWGSSSESSWDNQSINGYGEFASSRSWTTANGALTPDNLMTTTNKIDLSAVSVGTDILLSWDAGTIQGPNFYDEEYSVYLTTSNNSSDIISSTAIWNGKLQAPEEVNPFSIDVSSFAGQEVYLTFRHHNSEDLNMILVDNVMMKTADPIDATLSSLNLVSYAGAGNTDIKGVVTNNGSSSITSMDITWDDGNGPNVMSFNGLNLSPGSNYNFTHSSRLNVVGGENYNINVTVSLTNELNTSDNSLSSEIAGLTEIPTKVVVGEEKTGSWCGFCPRGDVGLSVMDSEEDFIAIAVHNEDEMSFSSYDQGTASYHPEFDGYPHGSVDRVITDDPDSFDSMFERRKNAIVPCAVKNIVAIYDESTEKISVSADAEFFGNISGVYRMSCVIMENNIIGSGNAWNQVNYYAGGARGPQVNAVTGFDWSTAASSVPSSQFGGYQHVALSLSKDNILGDPNSLTSNPSLGTQSYTFDDVSGNIIYGESMANVYAVVMIVDASTGEILNARKANISFPASTEEFTNSKFEFNIYPNPTSNLSEISFSLEEGNSVKMEVYNSLGSLVYSENAGVLNQGKQRMSFNGSDLNNGLYFINLTIGNEVISKRLILSK